jgi:uncharacterized membrane protein HdeD (DUF308 family)
MVEVTSQTDPGLSDQVLLPWWILMLWGLLTLIVGFMFLLNPGKTMEFFIVFLGAYWLVGGLFMIASLFIDRSQVGLKLFLSVINIIAGILILAYPLFATIFVLSFFIIFVGFWACFIGAAHIYQAFKAKDAGNGVLGIISIIFGVILLINPFIAAALLPFVFGGFAIVSGLASMYVAYTMKGLEKTTPA